MPTYTYIAKAELTGSQGTITFNNIPQTFTNLMFRGSLRTDNVAYRTEVNVIFNNNSSGVYNTENINMYRTGGTNIVRSFQSIGGSAANMGYASGTQSTSDLFSAFELYIPNYTTAIRKNAQVKHGLPYYVNSSPPDISYWIFAGNIGFNDTSAITRVDFTVVGNFIANSNIYLYGIKAA